MLLFYTVPQPTFRVSEVSVRLHETQLVEIPLFIRKFTAIIIELLAKIIASFPEIFMTQVIKVCICHNPFEKIGRGLWEASCPDNSSKGLWQMQTLITWVMKISGNEAMIFARSSIIMAVNFRMKSGISTNCGSCNRTLTSLTRNVG